MKPSSTLTQATKLRRTTKNEDITNNISDWHSEQSKYSNFS